MRLLTWFKEECIRVFPAVLYFAIALNLIHFTTGLALRPGETRYYTYYSVTLGALIIGKILIIINSLPFINAFPNKPLIYNISWKFCLYGIATLIFRVLDGFTRLSLDLDNASAAWQLVLVALTTPLFWSTEMWVLLIFLVFVIFNELINAVGVSKVKHMMFG
jgi:hypothetical protein